MPGDRSDRFDKAARSGSDVICLDWEDAVAEGNKAVARQRTCAYLSQVDVDAVVRVNASSTSGLTEDLSALKTLDRAVTLMLPKANIESVRQLQQQTDSAIIALIEDVQALEDAYQIADESNVVGVMLGGADLSAQTGSNLDFESLLYARTRLLYAGVAAQVAVIDTPSFVFADAEALYRETLAVKALGYTAKALIHPAQVEPVHRALYPTADEIEQAQAIVEAAQSSDGGAVQYRGTMVDQPIVDRARLVLARAEKRSPK